MIELLASASPPCSHIGAEVSDCTSSKGEGKTPSFDLRGFTFSFAQIVSFCCLVAQLLKKDESCCCNQIRGEESAASLGLRLSSKSMALSFSFNWLEQEPKEVEGYGAKLASQVSALAQPISLI